MKCLTITSYLRLVRSISPSSKVRCEFKSHRSLQGVDDYLKCTSIKAGCKYGLKDATAGLKGAGFVMEVDLSARLKEHIWGTFKHKLYF